MQENVRILTVVLYRKEDVSEQLEFKIWLLFNETNESRFMTWPPSMRQAMATSSLIYQKSGLTIRHFKGAAQAIALSVREESAKYKHPNLRIQKLKN